MVGIKEGRFSVGQCLCLKRNENVREVPKQDKNIDDKRMFKLGVDVLNRDFCIQIGYNRKAVKTYGQRKPEAELRSERSKREGSLDTTPEGPSDDVS